MDVYYLCKKTRMSSDHVKYRFWNLYAKHAMLIWTCLIKVSIVECVTRIKIARLLIFIISFSNFFNNTIEQGGGKLGQLIITRWPVIPPALDQCLSPWVITSSLRSSPSVLGHHLWPWVITFGLRSSSPALAFGHHF